MISWGDFTEETLPSVSFSYREGAEVVLPPSFSAVRPALEKMAAFCRARGLPENAPDWRPVELSTVEALNNAVEHGCLGCRPDARVILRWHWAGEWLEIEVLDPGSFFVPPDAPPPALPPPMAEHGRGLYLMHTLLNGQVRHERRLEGHIVTLRRRVGPMRRGFPEESLHDLQQSLEGMAEELSQSYESTAALLYLGECLATASDFPTFVRAGLGRLQALTGAKNAILRMLNEEGALELQEKTFDPDLDPPLPPRLYPQEESVQWHCVRGNREVTVEDCALLGKADPLCRPGSMAFCVPVAFQGDMLGVLTLLRRRHAEISYFTAGELGLARAVAEFLAIAWKTAALQRERAEKQQALRELEIASALQRSLLPSTFPDHPRFEIFGSSQSAREVGGDYFDAIALPDGGLLLLIADVMGKGLPAALLAAVFRTAVNARLPLATMPDLLLTEVNRQMEPDLAALGGFITAQAAYLDATGERLILASAGHCPALRMNRRRRTMEQLHGQGLPLGVRSDPGIVPRPFQIEAGDTLIFLTDGIYEVMNRREEPLELDGFMRSLSPAHADRAGAEPTCAELLDFVSRYEEGRLPADDRTLLIASPSPSARP